MGGFRNLAESNGRQKPAVGSKFRCYIIKIDAELGFWKAALRFTPDFHGAVGNPGREAIWWHFPQAARFMLGLPVRPNANTGISWSHSSIHWSNSSRPTPGLLI